MSHSRSMASRARRTGHLSMGVVGILAGALFATNASLFASADSRRPENLQDLVRIERNRLDQTNEDVTALRAEVSKLADEAEEPAELGPDPGVQFAAAGTPVAGPGVTVELWDAPMRDNLPTGVRPDDLVVHQQDLEAVMNGLWAGGAEAMTVQGHRVTARSSIRCVGNVLLIDGSVYSPPYEVAAVGDPSELERVLLSMPAIVVYQQYVEVLHLGWSFEASDELQMPAAEGAVTTSYAHPPGEDPITLPTTAPAEPLPAHESANRSDS